MCGPGDILSWEGGSFGQSSPSRAFSNGSSITLSPFVGPFTYSRLPPSHQHHDSFFFYLIYFVFHLRKCSKAYPIMLVFGFASGSTRSGLCASSCLCLS
ncbi:hypothetical protein ASPTUDRAFT_630137 [Aspergillus tubingensis CBS 134.48]|uniref:Uncharacterized protein n=1 Tax=Aspergillus tubingensis (strain CBS 134.48) TaxID=767770 RepID=A0A1L9N3M6_ASPTC|nr:hypothetical protein ASPTUDRAFT_630137 [Aspergillus tubingensis CBS 134.48]